MCATRPGLETVDGSVILSMWRHTCIEGCSAGYFVQFSTQVIPGERWLSRAAEQGGNMLMRKSEHLSPLPRTHVKVEGGI